MKPPIRAIHRQQRSKARPCLCGAHLHEPSRSSQAPRPLIQIHVTLILPRQLGRLLTGVTVGSLRFADSLLELASRILRTLLTG